jgi:hypothetical protein
MPRMIQLDIRGIFLGGSVHLLFTVAMGKGPLNVTNSCACFNRSNSQLSSEE